MISIILVVFIYNKKQGGIHMGKVIVKNAIQRKKG